MVLVSSQLIVSGAANAASFTGVGGLSTSGSLAYGVSADGTTVVGRSG